ncbi:SWIM zinc finger family protein [Pseudoscardovia suis]|uniref:SWIM-type domain-containing protein n=1 Tax=Pseudoscardovia suis TaxID=987063 RepID=A0A261EZ22_9BIFI|nr:SWIM zinc finger family protein [Pseudoscardovia suis]OZG52085.1 hypothetical protein PSSU_0868 [Pseudoscardovia suis]PJJ69316.1 hypothetical protein CLV65_0013 [Pseudoscardovia suis]
MPEGLQASLSHFDETIASSVMQRARDYWRRGLVSINETTDSNAEASATVHVGSANFTVTLTIADAQPSTTCTCSAPQPCRHAAAAMLELRDGKSPAHLNQDAVDRAIARSTTDMADIPHEMYDALLAAIVAKHDMSFVGGLGPESFTFIWTSRWQDMPADSTPNDFTHLYSIDEATDIIHRSLTDFTAPKPGQSAEDRAKELENTPIARGSAVFNGVHTVLENAIKSTDWEKATANICLCIRTLAQIVHVFNDKDGIARSHAHALMLPVTRYFTWMSEEAAPDVSGNALNELMKAGTDDMVMHIFSGGIPVFSCALPFARWDDTSMWAYEAMETADKALGTDTSVTACENRGFDIGWSRHRLIALRHDVAALAGDSIALAEARKELGDDVTAQTLKLASDVLRGDNDAAVQIVRSVNKANQATVDSARTANEALLMTLDINPRSELGVSGWLGVTEAVMQAALDKEGLEELYTNNILNATVKIGILYVPRMARLVGQAAWPAKNTELMTKCGRQLVQRRAMLADVNEQLRKQGKNPVPPVALRNPAYELLIIQNRDADAALDYIRVTGAVSKEMLDIVADKSPDEARKISDRLQAAQKARGEKPTELIDSKEYDVLDAADAAAAAVDAILRPDAHPAE